MPEIMDLPSGAIQGLSCDLLSFRFTIFTSCTRVDQIVSAFLVLC